MDLIFLRCGPYDPTIWSLSSYTMGPIFLRCAPCHPTLTILHYYAIVQTSGDASRRLNAWTHVSNTRRDPHLQHTYGRLDTRLEYACVNACGYAPGHDLIRVWEQSGAARGVHLPPSRLRRRSVLSLSLSLSGPVS
eukprot:995085-Rhodomonas_salina.1